MKVNAPEVLRSELARRSWRQEYVAIGTVTDPYQPIEGRYRLTRRILQAFADYETPAGIITRSPLVVRDIDVLQQLARCAGVGVAVSIATTDALLAREIEPTVAPPLQRFLAVRRLSEAGIKVSVALAPVIPHLTDSRENIASVVRAARDAGATRVWHNTLYLHDVTREAFFAYVRERRPDLLAPFGHIYKGTYAPRNVHEAIDRNVASALASTPMGSPDSLQPGAPRQISLL